MNKQEDPMDKFSRPVMTKDYKLGKLFQFEPRRDPKKPGRELVVTYDERFPAIPGFQIHYSYYVRFLEKGNAAGNHYHIKKQELFIPISGSFKVNLEDIETKEKEELILKAEDCPVFYVNSKTAHRTIANEENSVLLVLATSPNNNQDEYHYDL